MIWAMNEWNLPLFYTPRTTHILWQIVCWFKQVWYHTATHYQGQIFEHVRYKNVITSAFNILQNSKHVNTNLTDHRSAQFLCSFTMKYYAQKGSIKLSKLDSAYAYFAMQIVSMLLLHKATTLNHIMGKHLLEGGPSKKSDKAGQPTHL